MICLWLNFLIQNLKCGFDRPKSNRWERAQELLIADPSVSETLGSSYDALPLLVAVMNKPPLILVQSLIAANPGTEIIMFTEICVLYVYISLLFQ